MGLVPNVDVAWPSGARGTIPIRVASERSALQDLILGL
jgi:hypothetical protein